MVKKNNKKSSVISLNNLMYDLYIDKKNTSNIENNNIKTVSNYNILKQFNIINEPIKPSQ